MMDNVRLRLWLFKIYCGGLLRSRVNGADHCWNRLPDSRELNNVEKMLKPLKIHTIHVRTAFEARRALAKVLEEIGKL
jgi:hypothetical protein